MSLENALKSLRALSIGDGYGQLQGILLFSGGFSQELPPAPWRWTDDTHMAISIVENLREHGAIDQNWLAQRFADRHFLEPNRGYAGQASMLLNSVHSGVHWSEANVSNFPDGSYGNGAAMRAAPLGAFYPGDPERAAREAVLSAEITHAHPEGIAGGIAVAVAASINAASTGSSPTAFIDAVAEYTPASTTRRQMLAAKDFGPTDVAEAAAALGVGEQVTAQDTVPYCLFIASHYRKRFEAAMMFTAVVGGDSDTTCAIVAGILGAGDVEIPPEWDRRTEPLPDIV